MGHNANPNFNHCPFGRVTELNPKSTRS